MQYFVPKSIAEYPYSTMPDLVRCPDNNDLSLATAKLPKNSTLEEYVAYLDKTNKFAYTDYKRENMSNATVANLPAKELLYTYMDEYRGEDEIIKVLEITASSGNRTYEIKFTSPQFQFDDLIPTVRKMIDSINILPMPPCNFVRDNASLSEGKCTLKSSLGG